MPLAALLVARINLKRIECVIYCVEQTQGACAL